MTLICNLLKMRIFFNEKLSGMDYHAMNSTRIMNGISVRRTLLIIKLLWI